MKSKIKLNILRILFVISLIISILFISGTYGKYQEQLDTNYNIGIKRWNVKLNGKSLNSLIKDRKTLTEAIIEPTLPATDYFAEDTIAPGREGYFDMNIDFSQVDVPFTFDFSLEQTSNELDDFELYAYSIDDDCDGVSNDVMYYNLPSEYQQVEYIESTGTQYIDTGINPKTDTRVEMELSFDGEFKSKNTYGAKAGFFGSNDSNNDTFTMNFGAADSEGKRIYFWLDKIYGSEEGVRVYNLGLTESIIRNRNLFTIKSGLVTYGGLEKNIATKTNDNSIEATAFLFGYNSYAAGASPFQSYNMKVYSFKMYEGDVLVQNLVPCYRTSDNVVGMYDLVTETFFTNSSGTGEFNKGNDLKIEKVVIDPTKTEYESLDDEDKIVNVKAHVRWNDGVGSTMDNLADTTHTKNKSTLGYKATVEFEQYIEE